MKRKVLCEFLIRGKSRCSAPRRCGDQPCYRKPSVPPGGGTATLDQFFGFQRIGIMLH